MCSEYIQANLFNALINNIVHSAIPIVLTNLICLNYCVVHQSIFDAKIFQTKQTFFQEQYITLFVAFSHTKHFYYHSTHYKTQMDIYRHPSWRCRFLVSQRRTQPLWIFVSFQIGTKLIHSLYILIFLIAQWDIPLFIQETQICFTYIVLFQIMRNMFVCRSYIVRESFSIRANQY